MIRIDPFTFNSFQVNTYVVSVDSGECLVVDPSFSSPEEENRLTSHFSVHNLKVAGQANTHCHVDHILGVGALKSRYDCLFRAHREEASVVANASLMGEMFGLKVNPIDGIDEFLEDDSQIRIGNHHLNVLHVPGHSPGSLAFYSNEGGFVITGDALFQGSIGRTDLPGGNYDQLIRSIRSKLLVLPPETKVYPGHGPPSTIGKEKDENPFLSMVE